ncbi:MAG: hypothetical protein ACRBFS_17585 [Aureispira sp.]
MKKTTFYKIGALSLALLGAGAFTSFDGAMTDEQKIEAAYNQMVVDYKTEQTELCKTQALEEAQKQFAQMQAEMAGGDAPTYSGGSDKPTRNYSGSSSNTNTNTNSGEEPPVTTNTGGNTNTEPKKDPNAASTKGGATQQGSGGVSTKGGATQKGGATKSGDGGSVSTKGGAVKK